MRWIKRSCNSRRGELLRQHEAVKECWGERLSEGRRNGGGPVVEVSQFARSDGLLAPRLRVESCDSGEQEGQDASFQISELARRCLGAYDRLERGLSPLCYDVACCKEDDVLEIMMNGGQQQPLFAGSILGLDRREINVNVGR